MQGNANTKVQFRSLEITRDKGRHAYKYNTTANVPQLRERRRQWMTLLFTTLPVVRYAWTKIPWWGPIRYLFTDRTASSAQIDRIINIYKRYDTYKVRFHPWSVTYRVFTHVRLSTADLYYLGMNRSLLDRCDAWKFKRFFYKESPAGLQTWKKNHTPTRTTNTTSPQTHSKIRNEALFYVTRKKAAFLPHLHSLPCPTIGGPVAVNVLLQNSRRQVAPIDTEYRNSKFNLSNGEVCGRIGRAKRGGRGGGRPGAFHTLERHLGVESTQMP